MRDVITIGSATRDVFLLSNHFQLIASRKFDAGMGECVPLGAKIDVERKVESTGGGATNAAVTFARLGFGAAAVCRVGDDDAGRGVAAELAREGVRTALLRRVRGGETGYSTLLTAEGGERSVLVYRGVSARFTAADIPWDRLHARAAYLTSLGGNVRLSARLVRACAHEGALVAWNPGRGEIAAGLRAFKPALPFASVLLVNREEAAALTGAREPRDAFGALVRAGFAGAAVVTDGGKGATAFFRDRAWFCGTTGARSVSRTGAGDAFGSGLVAALLKGLALPQALAVGTLNAEGVIGKVGAKAGILKRWPGRAALARVPVKPFIL